MHTRQCLLAALVALAALAGCGGERRSPNIVLVVLDTVRSDHLSCYGCPRPTSPNLARIARESILYTQATASAPWTLPSHASMFTGLLSSRHMAHGEHLRLSEDRQTLAELLAARGYETAGFCNNPWITEQTGLAQGFEVFREYWRENVSRGTLDLNLFVDPTVHGIEDAGAARTLGQIEAWLGQRPSAGRPFFLFVNLIEAHSPYDPPPDFRNRFTGEDLSREDVRSANLEYVQAAYAGQLEEAQVARIRNLYDGELAYLDAWLARFVDLLRARGLLDDSYLIVTSDHGEGFGEHRLAGIPLIDHQLSLHQELLRVPLIVRCPGAERAGERIDAPVSLCDLFPTVLHWAGTPVPGGIDGVALPEDAGRAPADRLIDSQYYRPVLHLAVLTKYITDRNLIEELANRRLAAVRQGDHKVIVASTGHALRYDLDRDPGETSPLPPPTAPDPLITAAVTRLGEMQGSATLPPPQLEPAFEEALRSLGYVR